LWRKTSDTATSDADQLLFSPRPRPGAPTGNGFVLRKENYNETEPKKQQLLILSLHYLSPGYQASSPTRQTVALRPRLREVQWRVAGPGL